MDMFDFRDSMAELTNKIIFDKDYTEEGKFIDFQRYLDEFTELATTYLEIMW